MAIKNKNISTHAIAKILVKVSLPTWAKMNLIFNIVSFRNKWVLLMLQL
jgi:hypothetical protein